MQITFQQKPLQTSPLTRFGASKTVPTLAGFGLALAPFIVSEGGALAGNPPKVSKPPIVKTVHPKDGKKPVEKGHGADPLNLKDKAQTKRISINLSDTKAVFKHLNIGKLYTPDEVKKNGIIGQVHGIQHATGKNATQNKKMFILFIHNPKFPIQVTDRIMLKPGNKKVADFLNKQQRYDQIAITKGQLVKPLRGPWHLRVDEVKSKQKWQGAMVKAAAVGTRALVRFNDFDKKKSLHAMVHANLGNGKMLVLEHGDFIIPTVVPKEHQEEVQKLNPQRGDRVWVSFSKFQPPRGPMHGILTSAGKGKPVITMSDRLGDIHKNKIEKKGHLAVFLPSPFISKEAWAIAEYDPQSKTTRYYNLANVFEPKEATAIEKKLRPIWNRHKKNALNGRNKYELPQVKISAKGVGTIFSPVMANSILTVRAKDITVTEPPAKK